MSDRALRLKGSDRISRVIFSNEPVGILPHNVAHHMDLQGGEGCWEKRVVRPESVAVHAGRTSGEVSSTLGYGRRVCGVASILCSNAESDANYDERKCDTDYWAGLVCSN